MKQPMLSAWKPQGEGQSHAGLWRQAATQGRREGPCAQETLHPANGVA